MRYSPISLTKTLLVLATAPVFAHAVSVKTDLSQVNPADGRYIVVLKKPARVEGMSQQAFDSLNVNFVNNQALRLSQRAGSAVTQTYSRLLDGFVVKAAKAQARLLSEQAAVDYVVPDGQVSITPASPLLKRHKRHKPRNQIDVKNWGLSRIDNHELNLDGTYTYRYQGTGITAYVVDTGLNYAHQEFNGRASVYIDQHDGNGYQLNPAGVEGDDNGHATHVAGIIGGETTGVAKNVNLVGVKVLNKEGSGFYSDVIAGLEEVQKLADDPKNSGQRAIVNMSLGGKFNQALEDAIDALVKDNIPVVAAAGNGAHDACKDSPAHDPNDIAVGATDRDDDLAYYSSFGSCVQILAPGSGIYSAYKGSDHAYTTLSGTSMATPFVVGVSALYLEQNPHLTPKKLLKKLLKLSTADVIKNVPDQTPNKLVYSLAD